MIDPIRAFGPSLIERPDSAQRSSPSRKTKETQDASAREPLAVPKPKTDKDVVALSFNLTGDLKSLQQAVSTVFEQVRDQLGRKFGLPSEEEGFEKYLPGDNASQEEILSFVSPENTAKRIVGFATSFIDAFLAGREDQKDEESVDEFTTLITNAIKDGFGQAEAILGNFDELGDIGQNIEKTYDLVLEEIANFRELFLEKTKGASSEEDEESESGAVASSQESVTVENSQTVEDNELDLTD